MTDIQSNINVNVDTSGALSAIKNLQRQISVFQTELNKGSATQVAEATRQQQNLINNLNATGKFSAEIRNIKTTTESFTTALEKNKLSLGQYFKYSIASTKSFGSAFKTEMGVIDKVARERVKSLQTQYIQLGRDANGAMKAIAVRPLMLDLDNLQTKTVIAAQKQQLLNQLLKQGSTNLLNFGKNTQWAGRQLMVGFTIPLVLAGTAAAKAYMQIEQASVNIKRVYGDLNTSVAETNRMVDSIKNLATEYTQYGIAVADTMAMAAKAAAMGKTGADLLAQVGNASKLAALGGVDQNTALETTISLTNAFGISAEQLSGKVNFLNAVENQTVLSIEDMTTAIPKAAPVVKQLGGSIEDLTFFMTAMKEGGINASEGANALKSGLAALINPTKKSSDFLAGFGVNVKGIVEQDKGNLKKTVVDFATALDKIDPLNRARAIEMMFGKFQFARISTLLKNVTDQSSQAAKAAGLASMSSIQLAALSRKELDKISSSPMYKFEKAMADLQKNLAPVGEALLKAVTPIVGFVSKILDGFNGMSDQFKNFAVIGVAVIGGLAPVLLMVIGLVANGAANIIKLFANIKSFFNRTATASQTLGETTSYLTEEQIRAEAVAASLDQIHSKLQQTFTSEAASVDLLTAAYERSIAAQSAMGMAPVAGRAAAKGFATGGIVHGPGTSTSDSIPANLSNGEAVIDAETVRKNPAIIGALFAKKKITIPGYKDNNSNQFRLLGNAGFFNRESVNAEAGNHAGPGARVQDIAGDWERGGAGSAAPLLVAIAKKLGMSLKDVQNNPELLADLKQAGDSIIHVAADSLKRSGLEFAKDADIEAIVVPELRKAAEGITLGGQSIGKALDSVLDDFNVVTVKGIKGGSKQSGAEESSSRARIPGQPNYITDRPKSQQVARALNPDTFGTQEIPSKSRPGLIKRWFSMKGPDGSMEKAQVSHIQTDRSASFEDVKAKAGPNIDRVTRALGTNAVAKAIEIEQKGIVDSVEKSTEQKSPSKKARKAGENIGKGAIEGLESQVVESQKIGKKVVDATGLKSVTSGLPKFGKAGMLGPEGSSEVTYSQSGIRSASKSRRGPSPFMERMRASAAAAPSNLANEGRMLSEQAKDIFEQLKGIFRIGGQKAVEAVKTGLIDDSSQLTLAGQKLGFDYIEALKGGNGAIAAVVTSGNEKIIAAALEEYNKGGYKIAGAVSLGFDKGIAAEIASGLVARDSQKLADAIANGTYMAGSKQKKVPYGQEGPLLPGQTMAKMPIGQRITEMKNSLAEKASNSRAAISERYSAGKAKGAKFLDENILNKTNGSLAKIGGAATAAVFALSMIPGPIGSLMQSLLPFISIVSMLPPVFSALGISTTALTGEMVMAALPVVAVLALLAGGIALMVILNNQANEAKQREIDKINSSIRAHDNANKAMGELGKLAGITPGKDRSAVARTALAAGIGAKQASDVNILLDSAEFKDSKSAIGGMIGDIKGMTDTAAKDFLSSYANQLKGAGFDEKTINAMLNAIKIKAGKTNLKLDFASVDINTKKGRAQLGQEISDSLSGISKEDVDVRNRARAKVADPVVTKISGKDVKLSEIKKTLLPAAQAKYAAAEATLKVDPYNAAALQDKTKYGGRDGKGGLISQYNQLIGENSTTKIQERLKSLDKNNTGYAKTAAGVGNAKNTIVDNLNSAIGQFGTKAMSKTNFTAVMKTVQIELGKSSSKATIMAGVLKTLGPQATKGGNALAKIGKSASGVANKFNTANAQLDLFTITSANPTIGAKLIEQIGKVDVTAADAATQVSNLINVAKGKALGSSTGVTNTDLTGGDTTGGAGGTDPKQLLNDTKASVAANLMNINLMKKGYNSEFIDAISNADAATQKYYFTTLKNGTKVLNEQGRALLAAFNTKVIGDFLVAQKKIVSGASSELAARKTLTAAGLSAEDVKTMAARSDVQAALAAAKATVGATKRAAAIKSVTDALKGEKTATDSLLSAQDVFQKTYDKGTKYLDTQSSIISRDFEKNTSALSATILKANQDIQDLQTGAGTTTGLNQYNNGLSKLQFLETAINKKYDDRAKALDKVATINQRISDQQRGQLSLAQALASGDIAAAAAAAQDMNAQNASAAIADQKKAMDDAKQKELDTATVSVNGKLMTRKEIEDASAIIQQKILDIQISQLDPAQTALDLATRARDASLKNIADQKSQWDDWKQSIDAATTSLADYNKAIANAGPQSLAAANEAAGISPTDASISTSKAKFVASGLSIQQYMRLQDKVVTKSMGGIVPSYYAAGGYAKGTDTVPAMLTPGEFVVKKFAVDNFGVDKLNAINNGASLSGNVSTSVGVSNTNYDGSVYNYSVNVNVRSDANPDQIAQAVMMKINQTNGQHIRGNRFNG